MIYVCDLANRQYARYVT